MILQIFLREGGIMQANAAQNVAVRNQTLTESGASRKNQNIVNDTFVDILDSLQSSMGDSATATNTGTQSGYMAQNTDTAQNYEVENNYQQSDGNYTNGTNVNNTNNEANTPQNHQTSEGHSDKVDETHNGTQKVDEKDHGKVDETHKHDKKVDSTEGKTADDKLSKADGEGHEVKDKIKKLADTANEMAAMLQQMLTANKQVSQNTNVNPENVTKAIKLLKEVAATDNLTDAKELMSKLNALIKQDPELAKMVSKAGNTMAGKNESLKNQIGEMMSQLDPNFKLEVRQNTDKKANKSEVDSKAKDDFSFLESFKSYSANKWNSKSSNEMKEGQGNAENIPAKTNLNSNNAKTSSFEVEMKAFMHGRNFEMKTERTNTGKTAGEQGLEGITSGHKMMKNQHANLTNAAVNKGANQEAVIKNFKEVQAMVDQQMVQVKETSSSSMTLKLNPVELGKINIQLELLDNGKLQGKIFVENEITKQNLQQQMEVLKDQIKAQGVTLENFELNLGTGDSGQNFQGFNEQRQSNNQSNKSNASFADFSYDDEMSNQLQSDISQTVSANSKLNMLV